MVLHLACVHSAVKCVEYLLTTEEGRAAVNAYDDPLCYHSQDTTSIQRFVCRYKSRRTDITSTQRDNTPLHCVTEYHLKPREKDRYVHQQSIVEMLINAGADVNSKNANGCTPLNNIMNEVRDS